MSLKNLSVFLAIIMGSLMLSGYTGFPEVAGPGQGKYQAIVRDQEAVFVFPLDATKEYRWCFSGSTYMWNVDVEDNLFNFQFDYNFGSVNLAEWPKGTTPCQTGKVSELLKYGHVSVRKKSLHFAPIPNVIAEHEVSSDGTQLVLKIWDASVIKEMFSRKPKQVVFQWQLLDEKSSKRVAVNYPSGANPATTLLLSQVIGTWSSIDKQATIEFRKDMTWSLATGRDGKSESGKWRTLDNGRAVGMGENGEAKLIVKMEGSVLILNGNALHKVGAELPGPTGGSTIGSVGYPTQVAKDFVLAVTKGDATLMAKAVSRYFTEQLNQQGGLARLASEGRSGIEARGGYTIANVESEVIAGDTAEVTFKSIRGKETQQGTDKFFLIRENGSWKINGFSW